jgi:hypothetical protein
MRPMGPLCLIDCGSLVDLTAKSFGAQIDNQILNLKPSILNPKATQPLMIFIIDTVEG